MTTVGQVVAWVEGRYPTRLADDWDTPGLLVGSPDREVAHVMFAVDPTLAVAKEAVASGAQLLITHHPLMLRGVTTVAESTAKGAVVHALIEGGCGLLAAHTNADAAADGTNDALAAAFGMTDVRPLVPDAADQGVGHGRIGTIAPTRLDALAGIIAAALPATAQGVLFAGPADAIVRRLAVAGGSGESFIPAAVAAGADAFVTADLRHHPTLDAREQAERGDGKPYLLAFSHAASESLWLAGAAAALASELGVTTSVRSLTTDPWTGRAPSPTEGA